MNYGVGHTQGGATHQINTYEDNVNDEMNH